MELFITESHYIVQDGEYSLWCDRSNGSLHPKEGSSLCSAWNPVCMGVVYGFIGKLKLHPDSDWRLLLIRQRQLVGKLAGHNFYKIKKIAVVPLNTTDPIQDLDLELCNKHHFGMKKPERMGNTENQQMSFQKTWNTIKTAAENVKSKKKETKDREKFERRINEELLKMYNESDFFYYSDTYDLTTSLQRQNQSEYDQSKTMWARADGRFFWNMHMLFELMDHRNDLANHWIQPIIQGFVQIETCSMDFDEERRSSPGASPDFNSTFRLEPLSYDICLISRRSQHRAGTRSRKRGIDEKGAVANYVETEQIIEFAPHLVSFVQVRGSIPVFWSQSGVKYRPPPRLDRDEAQSHAAFLAHFKEQLSLFGQVVVVSLAEIAGKEQVVGDAYLSHVLQFNSPDVTYVTFDFHEYCRGMKFENVSILTDGIKDIIKKMRYCWVDNKGVICEQKGVFRVNCIDCLDRTNVVQTAIARIVMETQFRKLGLLPPEETLPPSCRRTYQQLWANNGDAISQQYAGTAALKGDFTRTGERKFSGLMKDGMNSANRYYLRFRDAYRQAAIDLTLGQPVSEDLLARPEGDVVGEEAGEDATDGDDQMEREENLKQLVEDCKRMLIVEPEQCLGGWTVINADPVVGDPDRQEMDIILLLSQRAVYVAWYDDEEEQITRYQRIFLEDVERLEIGAEPAVFKSRFACLRLYYRHLAEEGFFHTFRIPSMRLFNNVMVAVRNQEEAKESLRAIAQAFIAAQKILSLDLPLTERPKLDRKKTHPHPEVVDVHQQQQENSLASIHLPRDVSTDVHSETLDEEGSRPPSAGHLSVHSTDSSMKEQRSRSPSPSRSPQSRKRSPQLSPLRSPQQAAASALNAISQFSAKTMQVPPKALSFLKPANLKVANIAPLNLVRQLRRPVKTEEAEGRTRPGSEGDKAAECREKREDSLPNVLGGPLGRPEERRSAPASSTQSLDGDRPRADSNRSQSHDDLTERVALRTAKTRSQELLDQATHNRELFLVMSNDHKEVNLDSCGIIAATPTHVLVSSLSWATAEEDEKKKLRRSLDLDHVPGEKKEDRSQHSKEDISNVVPKTSPASTDQDKSEAVKTPAKPDEETEEEKDVFESPSCPDRAATKADSTSITVAAERRPGRLRKSSSAEDVQHIVSDVVSDKESYCVLDEAEVKAILRKSKDVSEMLSKSDTLHHPHLKISLSDNSLSLQQQPPGGDEPSAMTVSVSDRPESGSAFSRFRTKMSTLAVPRSSAPRGQTPLAISKSHIRKSQRAMEVFEKLVREKLKGQECETRIIFI